MADKYLLGFLSRGNLTYIDSLYEQFEKDPFSVPEPWYGFFVGMTIGNGNGLDALANGHAPVASNGHAVPPAGPSGVDIRTAFQTYGYRVAPINPLQDTAAPTAELDPRRFGVNSEADWKTPQGQQYLQLRAAYAGPLSGEFTYLDSQEEKTFLAAALEQSVAQRALDTANASRVYSEVFRAEALEQFLHTRFIGQKRFSLEGAETMMPLLTTVFDEAANSGVRDIVLGMAHRGRINVLVHLLGKPYAKLFSEFLGQNVKLTGDRDGDVKYHLGGKTQFTTASGKEVALQLCENPSHLEIVNPVVSGIVAGRQTLAGNLNEILPVLVHGEAAFMGQGLVVETMMLANLPATHIGGTVHVIVNNQVGFTADGNQTRLSRYPTEWAKSFQIPVLHVNGCDTEAVVAAGRIAAQYRQKFHKDVFIHLCCYRKYGHNEGDDPSFTQPLLYRKLEGYESSVSRYRRTVTATGRVTEADIAAIEKETLTALDEALQKVRASKPEDAPKAPEEKAPKKQKPPTTAVSASLLEKIGRANTAYPSGFTVHPKVGKILEQRVEMATGARPVDWGCGEMFAFGSLLLEGRSVRLHGQDVERGTFSHRHSVLHDYENGKIFAPLGTLGTKGATYWATNSLLSEAAVMGYEYGFTIADPERLVMWEAQFGDFVNGAQAVIDQYLSASETKWGVQSGLVLLLPHGFEGQGPEHSSARLERFLELSAKNNWYVCQPSNASQHFHMIRRHAQLEPKRPLIVMTPKSLLRLPQASAPLSDFTDGSFQTVWAPDTEPKDATTVLLCSGRIAYTLDAARSARERKDVAILRMEQLYPLPKEELAAALARFPKAKDFVWVQDEPENMGAWRYMYAFAGDWMPSGKLRYCGRVASSSPATGYPKRHEKEEADILEAVLGKK